MKIRFLLALGLFAAPLAVPVSAQPPEPRKPPKPVVPPISLEQANKEIGGPTLVTLHLKDATPENVLKEFSRATGVAVRMQYWNGEDRKQKITLDLDNQPFWLAMRDLCSKLGASPQPYGGDSVLMLQPRDNGGIDRTAMPLSPLVSLRLDQINYSHTLSLQGDNNGAVKMANDNRSMSLQSTFLFDPKLRPLQGSMRVTLAEAVDDKGVAMANDQVSAYIQMPLMCNLHVPLKWRADMGKKIVRLRGSAKCYVTTRHEAWEIADVMNAKESSKTVRGPEGEETYTFLGIEKKDNQYQVRVKITRPLVLVPTVLQPEGQQLSYIRRDIGRMVKLQDAQGLNLRWQGGNGGGDEDETVIYFGQFQEGTEKSGEPQKMVLDIPLEFRELEVPFDVKDVPLP